KDPIRLRKPPAATSAASPATLRLARTAAQLAHRAKTGTVSGKSETIANFVNADFEVAKLEPSDVKIRVYGNVAGHDRTGDLRWWTQREGSHPACFSANRQSG